MEKEKSFDSATPAGGAERLSRAKPIVTFQESLCKGCELCVSICPTKILKLDTSRVNHRGYNPAVMYNPQECTGCAGCAKICPDSVITVCR